MRDYIKPTIEEELIEIEDICGTSPAGPMGSPEDEFDPETPGDGLIL